MMDLSNILMSVSINKKVLDEINEDILLKITSVCFESGLSLEASALVLQAIIDKKKDIEEYFAAQNED